MVESKWKNFSLVVVLVTAVFTAFFLAQRVPMEEKKGRSFLDLYQELSGAWKGAGVKGTRLHEAFSELGGLPSRKLGEIKANILEYKKHDDKRIALLASAYLDLVDFAIESREHKSALDDVRVSHDKSTCETLGLYERLNDSTKHLVSIASVYSVKLDSFISKYPSEAKQISLKEFVFDSDKALKVLAKQGEAVDYFKEKCRK